MNEANIMMLSFLISMLMCPLLATAGNCLPTCKTTSMARLGGNFIGLGFLISASMLAYLSLTKTPVLAYQLISINTLSILLCNLVCLVSFIVHKFSLRYMHGDRLYRRFFILLSMLTFSALIMVLADNLFLFWGAWSMSNIILTMLMVHKKEWEAARNSGVMAFYNLMLGSGFLILSFAILYCSYSIVSISAITQLSNPNNLALLYTAMSLIVLAALIQSGILPFHRWLISSLNSPTPVSALMHAGLVNGGGILIVKFSPLIINYPNFLTVIFTLGALSAILGTIWKLMQNDIKKMLTCSTMAQMGFMMMQCGLGLFAAAIAHLCWHGLFKANLFLSSGSALKQNKTQVYKASPLMIITSLFGGVIAMLAFALASHKTFSVHSASTFILLFACIAGSQMMLTWIGNRKTILGVISGLIISGLSGLMYGASVHLIEYLLPGLSYPNTYQLSFIHWITMGLFIASWVVFNIGAAEEIKNSKLGCWLYMFLFNSSQPSRKTITALRSNYNY